MERVKKERDCDRAPTGCRGRKMIPKCCSTKQEKVWMGFPASQVYFFLLQAVTIHDRVRDHYLVQYLENIGAAKEQYDWLVLVIGPLAALVV